MVTADYSRDTKLTEFGKLTLSKNYLLPDESYQDLFIRVSKHYADNDEHAERLYTYMSNLWFMPATPILSNGGTSRGYPISCFLNDVDDNLKGIVESWVESIWLAARGGGVGTYWGNVRSIGERVGIVGETSGIIPFVHVQDSLALAISQGSLRRGSTAVYIPVWHPEIDEFLEMRKKTGGDPNRKAQNLHQGIVVDDKFMLAVEADLDYDLLSPKDNKVVRTVKARAIWIKILAMRLETGEPYLLFIDAVNKALPIHHKVLDMKVKQSNLCSEITLPTGKDYLGAERTAVCCLSSLNLETYDEWKDNELFIEDILKFLDNVLQDFIDKTDGVPGFEKARYSAMMERSIGLGTMGFHSYLQSKMIPMESAMAKSFNMRIFKKLKEDVDIISKKLSKLKGACPDSINAFDKGLITIDQLERFSYKLAIAPNASISTICGQASPGIEPFLANAFTTKGLTGFISVKNKYLKKLLEEKGQDTDEVWSTIVTSEGSVDHLDFLTQDEKDIFKTAAEMDQRWLIEHAADRVDYVCQAQSLNIFLKSDVDKRDLNQIHLLAWKKGVKSLYYCRSISAQRSEKVSTRIEKHDINYDECIACQ